ncbi:ankyrin repeat-containing domain protein [Mycena polygramma]|nr:ankyrin repeat-containing domain protein [Mycena polygramma]
MSAPLPCPIPADPDISGVGVRTAIYAQNLLSFISAIYLSLMPPVKTDICMSAAPPCAIPADPDISGVGVRTAIYAQNLLSFIPAIWALWDGEVSDYELECVETQSTTILVTAFAILISAMVQVSRGLSNFHASIVLDLSWMNNTNTFIYFLLYVQHKSQPGPQQIEPTFSAWIYHLRDRLAWDSSHERKFADAESTISKTEADASPDAEPESSKPGTRAVARQKAWFKAGFRRIVMVLGSLHLSLMAGLGIWLWSDPGSFGSTDPCVVNIARIAILGRSVPLRSTGLRGWSIAIYSLFLAPGLNLILPAALFLGLFLGYQTWNTRRSYKCNQAGIPATPSADHGVIRIPRGIRTWYNRLPATPSIFPTVVGMILLFATNLIFLVDIELTLLRNRAHQTAGESEWTFGQILALLLLVLPLRDLVETMLARRETKRQEELARREKQRRYEHAASLRNAIEEKATMRTILDLIQNGADVDTYVEDCEYPTALILAASRGDTDSVRALLECGAAPNLRGGKDGSALLSACCNGHGEAAKLLLQHRADPTTQGDHGAALSALSWNEHAEVVQTLLEHGQQMDVSALSIHIGDGGKYTALQAASKLRNIALVELLLARGADINAEGGVALQEACSTDNLAVVELLLERGADPNMQGGYHGNALQAAVVSSSNKLAVVEALLAHGADVNIQDGEYGTALQAASNSGHVAVVELLLARGADINIQDGEYGTALQAASYQGHVVIAELLLARGADINIQDGEYGTALQAASNSGHVAVVELLLAHRADVNIQGGYYGTALQASSRWGHTDIVQLLLARGADVNMQGGEFGTALQAALCQGEIAIVELLLAREADVHVQGGPYGTAIQAASYGGSLAVVELLLARGADVNLQGGEYGTALRAAVVSQWIDDRNLKIKVANLLLSHGADPNLGADNKYGPILDRAKDEQLVELLRAHGAV